ncbi:Homoserine dehydrogenase [Oligella ureolytica]|uniref:Homoserine dehydrogenase n=1 Tax=Oligella ureolytica TaxID=90244 RepID=A0A378XKI6_9BURK|nr:homoserine dehydrogenase [Oligella ureolytica]QPT39868.1 homoserine dehydrogenase [Oligella ureolytica]SUA52013.1 Homoserine dehydrogenase [Oligella ureolytica]SUA57827.1 Homoserine dehydrogenase [Oligella ureolytica]
MVHSVSDLKPVKVGLLGFGVVGSGAWAVLNRNADEIARRAGCRIEIVRIATRNPSKITNVPGHVRVDDDLMALVQDPDIDIVVELIGGSTLARELILAAIAEGKHVVTANKALLALHGNEIFAEASAKGVMVAFEAAVAGGIPIIKSIREGLTANRIQWLAGIINGTTNFILSEMRRRNLDFATALQEAQDLGYAEADPTFDIEGIDAAHKLALLASIAFGIKIQFDKVYVEGISHLAQEDFIHAQHLGYRIKLLAIARHRKEGIELRVHPTLVKGNELLANVEGSMNAVLVRGDAVGETLYYGPGAGSEPTASAVIADLVDVTRMHHTDPENRVPHLAFQPDALADYSILPIEDTETSYYLRLLVDDQSGVMAEITRVLAEDDISIDSMVQEQESDGKATIIFLTHKSREGDIEKAIGQIEQMPFVHSKVTRIRLEQLEK